MAGTGEARSRTELVYRELHQRLVHGRFAPNQRLHLADLCAESGVSLSVVREALTRLATQGLVRSEPNRGFYAPDNSITELADLAFMRCNIEELAVRRSIERGDAAWESSVVAAHHQLTLTPLVSPLVDMEADRRWNLAHRAFHDACAAACGSRRLLSIRARLYDESEIMRQMSELPSRNVAAEHAAILTAIVARDADEASRRVRDHIDTTARLAIASVRSDRAD
ncbi:GntR family transcriptional regulator [Rhodococcus sp. BP-149]|uniref:GntR family transcriptional regulator n=1 Tax=unclassified Rhodococcus (in: high G+C Gram-positive bacteria) TaxID=192944 RepID=UPI001C9B365D|nr:MULTISPECIES: GntR family transcriptional regulator [unclassified Rhodococcus (in: high G+C Gram-positive bacteria)]MBY6685668.1 GntR family transcriptional regulator [Rhodococcus sp. BP-288]MBY6694784.1 GntR family transcriptional regulator [Rhodococcus sp. BP-188]MBY6696630.1 GntR family transcriptional regulator [Rhodococcus sp. BP-285]MBY6703286.1 GntR family transcriptional regulator [Rhodococcus sp. BP-283]MBY6708609.1 GntR family transcriptional regulator [Rhodococcus sp. BP-241]